jgi:hypothetical protein
MLQFTIGPSVKDRCANSVLSSSVNIIRLLDFAIFVIMVDIMADQQIKILFTDGSWVNFQKPPNFNLPSFVHGVRSIGMVLTDSLYIPLPLIKAIMDLSMATEVEFGMPTVPGTETRQ